MNSFRITNKHLLQLIAVYWQWRWLWMGTTLGFTVIGLVYVLFIKTDEWVATQGLITRDEANGAVVRLGRFESQSEMKVAQETILELARNKDVVRQALQRVGMPATTSTSHAGQSPIPAKEIEKLQDGAITVRAPRGAELGTTELIYLDVKQASKQRALTLNEALCDALEATLQAVRRARADGVIAELETAKANAEERLNSATNRLQQMERSVGTDLGDLRGLIDSNNAGNTSRQVLDRIKDQILEAETQLRQYQIDLEFAQTSLDLPGELLMTPSRLVAAHPGLLKLREGLADAKLRLSTLSGKYTRDHPMVKSAVEAEQMVREQLRQELKVAIESLRKDIESLQTELGELSEQRDQLTERLTRLASTRSAYSNAATDVRARNDELQDLEREYAQALASRQAALNSSLITRVNKPMVDEDPIGPGRSTILAGISVCGLMFGLGIVFLLNPIETGATVAARQPLSTRPAMNGDEPPARQANSRPVERFSEVASHPPVAAIPPDGVTQTAERVRTSVGEPMAGEHGPASPTATETQFVYTAASDDVCRRVEPAPSSQ